MQQDVINVTFAGLGGQGVLTASDILAEAAFAADLDVKKSELHGMSQRGGSVTSDVRFGSRVLSPMIPAGESHFLVVLSSDQVEVARPLLADGGVLITPDDVDTSKLESSKSLNVCLLGVLSRHLKLSEECWRDALKASLPERLHESNLRAFALGAAVVA